MKADIKLYTSHLLW